MKKIMTLGLFMLLVFISGCVEQPNEKDVETSIDYTRVGEVVNLINILHSEISDDDRENIGLIEQKYEQLNEDEQALIHNYEYFEYAKAVLAALDEARIEEELLEAQVNEIFDNIELELSELIPDEVYEHLDFPYIYETNKGLLSILWVTSDPFTISNRGIVTPGREEIDVEITSTIVLGKYRRTITQTVVVLPIQFETLPTNNLVFAYAYNTAHGFTDLEKNTVNVVNHSFATINPDEGVVSILALSGRQNVMELRRSGIRVVFSILGYGAETPTRPNSATRFSEIARTAQGRFKFAQSIVEAVVKYHFDGVDVDWEYPGYGAAPGIDQATDTKNYSLLIQEIHRQLKAVDPDYILSTAVPGGPWGPNRYDVAEVNKYLDYFHLMTYDMDSSNTSTHHSALFPSSNTINGCSVKQTVDLYISLGASPEKLVIGAAFYGREFTLSNTGNIMQAQASSRRSISYSEIVSEYYSRIDSGVVVRYWDDDAKAPYLYNTQTNRVVVYDDYESVKYKSQFAISQELGGIMFWQFAQDNTRTLMQSIHDNLRNNQ